MSELYNKIAALCEDRGITVTELCRRCDVSRASLSDLKAGRKHSLSTQSLSKIAGYFRVPTDFLLGLGQSEAPGLPEPDAHDLARRLDALLCDLADADEVLLFDGAPLDADTRELLLFSLQNQRALAERIVRQRSATWKHCK